MLELAGWVCSNLAAKGFKVVLSGGACASIYSENKYESLDLDFIRVDNSPHQAVAVAMESLGFKRHGRSFFHPDSKFSVEFPPPPLTVGSEPVREVREMDVPDWGRLSLLSPTDCVKDRLCGFYFWNDRQCLDQAVLVGFEGKINLAEIQRWSIREEMSEKFAEFKKRLRQRKAAPKVGRKRGK